MSIEKKVISEEARNGMLYRREGWSVGGNPDTELDAVYSVAGNYIGDTATADYLASRGILPELRTETSCVCSIGFSEKEQKWFGWSHRALAGFGIGDEVAEGDCVADSLPVGFKAASLDDAKKMAVAFAESVS